jgi:hypothetical protein
MRRRLIERFARGLAVSTSLAMAIAACDTLHIPEAEPAYDSGPYDATFPSDIDANEPDVGKETGSGFDAAKDTGRDSAKDGGTDGDASDAASDAADAARDGDAGDARDD